MEKGRFLGHNCVVEGVVKIPGKAAFSMTECSETLVPFEAHFSRQVVAQFEGSWLTSDGGSLLRSGLDRYLTGTGESNGRPIGAEMAARTSREM
jgi:hypothetical protein